MTKATMQENISNEELDQRWRLNWITCIFEYSNLKLQQMSWVEEESRVNWPRGEVWVSDYFECMSDYFDGQWLNKGYTNHIEEGRVSKEEAEIAKEFHELADVYKEPSNDSGIILKDLGWLKIVNSSKKLWDFLKVTVISKREVDLMNQLEKDFGKLSFNKNEETNNLP